MTKIKFCGFTRIEDVIAAVEIGVDFIGLNFVPASQRYITPDFGSILAEKVKVTAKHFGLPAPGLVGVFIGDDKNIIDITKKQCQLDYLQICQPERWHGQQADLPLIYCWRPTPNVLPPIHEHLAWAHLIDANHPGALGGTGKQADWDVAAVLSAKCRLFLAGGLRPGNVAQAVSRVLPYAVDIASGIESCPGVKDRDLMKKVITEVKLCQ